MRNKQPQLLNFSMNQKKHFSYTATFIIIKLFGLSTDPLFVPLIDEKASIYYKKVVSQLPIPLNFFKFLLKYSWIRRFSIFMEDLILPGDLMHLLMRKAYIKDAICHALNEGYEQVVVIGSGLDFSAIRTSGLNIDSFEVDAGDTINLKYNLIKQLHYQNDHLHFVPVHIRESGIYRELSDHPSFKLNKPTLFIAEGFLDYQELPTIYRILHDMNKLTGNKSRFVFTLFDFNEMDPVDAQIIRDSVKFVGEHLKHNIGRGHIEKLLHSHDFNLRWIVDPLTMKAERLKPLGIKNPLFKGFYIMMAESVN